MANYEYQCPYSLEITNIVLSMKEDVPKTIPCTTCRAAMARVWNSPGVIFNASGFYSNGG